MEDRELFERRLGTVLRDKWTLERLLGVGGMAAVYLGVHKIGRREAIKILHPEVARNKELCERFEREAHAVNRLKHPGAVEIRDVDVTDDGAPFLVMELLEGESLSERARRQNGIEVGELLRLVDELLDVLAAAHAQSIVHRDIKLDNLFVQTDGRLKVLDFGIARMRHGASRMLTRTGARLGTVAYMPPEQVRGLEIDHRADLFAVGATMFRVVGRRRIHDAPSEPELLVKMGSIPAPPLASVADGAPHGLCLVVDRALAFHRERRYPDALTMQLDVQALRRGEEPPHASARLAAGDVPSLREAPPGAPDLSRPFDSGSTGASLVETPAPHARHGAAIEASQRRGVSSSDARSRASTEATVAHGAGRAPPAGAPSTDPTRADLRSDPTRAALPSPSPLAASLPAPLAGASAVGGTVVIGSVIDMPASLPLSSTLPGATGVAQGHPHETTLRSAVASPPPISVGAHSVTSPSACAPAAGTSHTSHDSPPSIAVVSAPGVAGASGYAAVALPPPAQSLSGRRSSPLPFIIVGGVFLLVGGSIGAWVALGSEDDASPAAAEPQTTEPPAAIRDPTATAPGRLAGTARPKTPATSAPAATNAGVTPAPKTPAAPTSATGVPQTPAQPATAKAPPPPPVAQPVTPVPPPAPPSVASKPGKPPKEDKDKGRGNDKDD